jgi:hypothetical protein
MIYFRPERLKQRYSIGQVSNPIMHSLLYQTPMKIIFGLERYIKFDMKFLDIGFGQTSPRGYIIDGIVSRPL